jgi:hypothetical protein
MVEINDVLGAAPDATTIIEGLNRLVDVDHNHVASLIRLDELDAQGKSIVITAPFMVRMSDLLHEIKEGRILVGQEFDCGLPPTVESLSMLARQNLKQRLTILSELISPKDGDPDAKHLLFDPDDRGRIFKAVAKKCKVATRTVRRLCYQYFWGGQTELALAPQIKNRGGKGKKQRSGSLRRGRKLDGPNASQVSLPEVRDLLEKGAKLFYLPGCRTLEEAHMATKKKYFSKGKKVDKGCDPPITEILLPPEKLPSLQQFRHVCADLQKNGLIRKGLVRRIRQKPTQWKFRGRNHHGVPGPGYRYEIDATIIQIRPVSRFNRRRLIKEVTLYIVIDVWSGVIVGYALSLHKASWAMAAKALKNCFTDKQEVFDRLNLGYTSADWPCHQLPSQLAADRGEMVSDKADRVPEIGIKVEIKPPMCPEMKGKVEASIKDVKHGHSHHLPGRHPKFRQRRETDGSDTAALTVEELERVIVEIILGINHSPAPESHIPPELVESGETNVTRIGLFEWGLKNLPGFTRKMSETEVYTNLMTKGVATISPRGLSFKCQTFYSLELHNAATYKPPSGRRGFLVDIRYDEHCADRIWFLNTKTNQWVEAINDDPNVLRRKAAFYELEILRDEIKKLRRACKDESLHREDIRRQNIAGIVKEATKETKEATKGLSRAGRKKNISENTALEKAAAELIASGATAPPTPAPALAALIDAPKIQTAEMPQVTTQQTPSTQTNPAPAPLPSVAARSKKLWRK